MWTYHPSFQGHPSLLDMHSWLGFFPSHSVCPNPCGMLSQRDTNCWQFFKLFGAPSGRLRHKKVLELNLLSHTKLATSHVTVFFALFFTRTFSKRPRMPPAGISDNIALILWTSPPCLELIQKIINILYLEAACQHVRSKKSKSWPP